MKKLPPFLMILSLSLFTIGCSSSEEPGGNADTPDDASTSDPENQPEPDDGAPPEADSASSDDAAAPEADAP